MNKNSNDSVSVIITTYKRDIIIVKRAIESVVNQKYNNIELIVVNDNPDDLELNKKLNELLKKYTSIKTKYIVVDKNGGACKARNIGIKESSGNYIAFLDDDDEWLDSKVEEQVKCFKINKNAGIVYCNAIIYDEDKEKEIIRFKKIQPSGNIHDYMLVSNIIGSCSFPMFTREVLDEFNGFREDMPAMQDWELYIRISEKYKCYYISKPLAIYHKYKGERISKNYKKRVLAHRKIEEEFGEKIKKNKNALYAFHIGDCNVYSAAGKYRTALKYLFKAIIIKPFKIINNGKTFAKLVYTFITKDNRI